MSSVVFNQDGGFSYRTKLMKDQSQVARFAKCLSANPRFTNVEVVESQAAKNGGWFITFRPASTERQKDMYEEQWNQRKVRALEEGADYVIWQDESRQFFWCFNPLSGEVYEMSLAGCSCPDYQYRCRRAALHCKHLLAWNEATVRRTVIYADERMIEEVAA